MPRTTKGSVKTIKKNKKTSKDIGKQNKKNKVENSISESDSEHHIKISTSDDNNDDYSDNNDNNEDNDIENTNIKKKNKVIKNKQDEISEMEFDDAGEPVNKKKNNTNRTKKIIDPIIQNDIDAEDEIIYNRDEIPKKQYPRYPQTDPTKPIGELNIEEILSYLIEQGRDSLNPKLKNGSLNLLRELKGMPRRKNNNGGSKTNRNNNISRNNNNNDRMAVRRNNTNLYGMD